MMPECTDVRGRVLLVEDEMMIAMMLEDVLEDLGYEVAGIAATVDAALHLIHTQSFEVAILDLNLSGASSLPVAEVLAQQGCPFILSTGYAATSLPEKFAPYPTLQKPYELATLQTLLSQLLSQATPQVRP